MTLRELIQSVDSEQYSESPLYQKILSNTVNRRYIRSYVRLSLSTAQTGVFR